MSKPVLIGMNNPISKAPRYALYPLPIGCTGNRLWRMLNDVDPVVAKSDYVYAFDRRNLVTGPWDDKIAAARAAEMTDSLCDRNVVLLGEPVRRAFGLEKHLIHPILFDGVVFRQIPHPSGLNRWYNDPHNRLVVGLLLRELYNGAATA